MMDDSSDDDVPPPPPPPYEEYHREDVVSSNVSGSSWHSRTRSEKSVEEEAVNFLVKKFRGELNEAGNSSENRSSSSSSANRLQSHKPTDDEEDTNIRAAAGGGGVNGGGSATLSLSDLAKVPISPSGYTPYYSRTEPCNSNSNNKSSSSSSSNHLIVTTLTAGTGQLYGGNNNYNLNNPNNPMPVSTHSVGSISEMGERFRDDILNRGVPITSSNNGSIPTSGGAGHEQKQTNANDYGLSAIRNSYGRGRISPAYEYEGDPAISVSELASRTEDGYYDDDEDNGSDEDKNDNANMPWLAKGRGTVGSGERRRGEPTLYSSGDDYNSTSYNNNDQQQQHQQQQGVDEYGGGDYGGQYLPFPHHPSPASESYHHTHGNGNGDGLVAYGGTDLAREPISSREVVVPRNDNDNDSQLLLSVLSYRNIATATADAGGGGGGGGAMKTNTALYRGGYLRQDVIKSHIKKPKLSTKRVKLLCNWLNSLSVWHKPVTIRNFKSELACGLLLANLLKKIDPNASKHFLNLNKKAKTTKAAIINLEQSIGFIWRLNKVNNSRIPSAQDIYSGSFKKVSAFIMELFQIYVAQPNVKLASTMISWYDTVLRQYNRSLPSIVTSSSAVFVSDEDAVHAGSASYELWNSLRSGGSLFCVVYHFVGAVTVVSSHNHSPAVQIDPQRVVWHPNTLGEFRTNIAYVFDILTALDVEVIWDVDDWCLCFDIDFLLLQLRLVYDTFKDRQCVIPLAQGNQPGVAYGPRGQPLIVGVVFADTLPNAPDSVTTIASPPLSLSSSPQKRSSSGCSSDKSGQGRLLQKQQKGGAEEERARPVRAVRFGTDISSIAVPTLWTAAGATTRGKTASKEKPSSSSSAAAASSVKVEDKFQLFSGSSYPMGLLAVTAMSSLCKSFSAAAYQRRMQIPAGDKYADNDDADAAYASVDNEHAREEPQLQQQQQRSQDERLLPVPAASASSGSGGGGDSSVTVANNTPLDGTDTDGSTSNNNSVFHRASAAAAAARAAVAAGSSNQEQNGLLSTTQQHRLFVDVSKAIDELDDARFRAQEELSRWAAEIADKKNGLFAHGVSMHFDDLELALQEIEEQEDDLQKQREDQEEYFTFLLDSIRAGYAARTQEREEKEKKEREQREQREQREAAAAAGKEEQEQQTKTRNRLLNSSTTAAADADESSSFIGDAAINDGEAELKKKAEVSSSSLLSTGTGTVTTVTTGSTKDTTITTPIGEDRNDKDNRPQRQAEAAAEVEEEEVSSVSISTLLGLSKVPQQYGLASRTPLRSFMSPTKSSKLKVEDHGSPSHDSATSSRSRGHGGGGLGTAAGPCPGGPSGSIIGAGGLQRTFFTVDDDLSTSANDATPPADKAKAEEREKREKGWNVWTYKQESPRSVQLNKLFGGDASKKQLLPFKDAATTVPSSPRGGRRAATSSSNNTGARHPFNKTSYDKDKDKGRGPVNNKLMMEEEGGGGGGGEKRRRPVSPLRTLQPGSRFDQYDTVINNNNTQQAKVTSARAMPQQDPRYNNSRPPVDIRSNPNHHHHHKFGPPPTGRSNNIYSYLRTEAAAATSQHALPTLEAPEGSESDSQDSDRYRGSPRDHPGLKSSSTTGSSVNKEREKIKKYLTPATAPPSSSSSSAATANVLSTFYGANDDDDDEDVDDDDHDIFNSFGGSFTPSTATTAATTAATTGSYQHQHAVQFVPPIQVAAPSAVAQSSSGTPPVSTTPSLSSFPPANFNAMQSPPSPYSPTHADYKSFVTARILSRRQASPSDILLSRLSARTASAVPGAPSTRGDVDMSKEEVVSRSTSLHAQDNEVVSVFIPTEQAADEVVVGAFLPIDEAVVVPTDIDVTHMSSAAALAAPETGPEPHASSTSSSSSTSAAAADTTVAMTSRHTPGTARKNSMSVEKRAMKVEDELRRRALQLKLI